MERRSVTTSDSILRSPINDMSGYYNIKYRIYISHYVHDVQS